MTRAEWALLIFPKIEIFFLHCPAAVFCAIDPMAIRETDFCIPIAVFTNWGDDIFIRAKAAFNTNCVFIAAFISFCLSLRNVQANE